MMQKFKRPIIIFAAFMAVFTVIIFLQVVVFSKSATQNGKIVIEKELELPFLANVKQDNIVLYFGYVGCTKVCMPILDQLKKVYATKPQSEQEKVAVVFVNLTPEISPESPAIFAASFSEKLYGIYLTKHQLHEIPREFNLFYSAGVVDKDEITHSDSIYLLKRNNGKYTLKSIYLTHPLNTNLLSEDITKVQK